MKAEIKVYVLVDAEGSKTFAPVKDECETIMVQGRDVTGALQHFESDARHLPSWVDQHKGLSVDIKTVSVEI